MTKQNKIVHNSNIDFIQLKLCDFSDEEIDQEKIISERLNKTPNFENTNHELFLDENNTFKYDNPICPVCGSHKILFCIIHFKLSTTFSEICFMHHWRTIVKSMETIYAFWSNLLHS